MQVVIAAIIPEVFSANLPWNKGVTEGLRGSVVTA